MQTLSYIPQMNFVQPAFSVPQPAFQPSQNISLDVLALLQNTEVLNTLSLLQSTAEKCEYCGNVLLFSKIFLVHDDAKNKDLFVCSSNCQQLWLNKLSQSIASLSSQILQNSAQLIQAPLAIQPKRSDVKAQSKSNNQKFSQKKKNQRIQKQQAKRTEEVVQKRKESVISQPKIEKKYSIVVDTQTILNHLQEILNLKFLDNITVVIPELVIRDLDKLKKNEGKNGVIARAALRTILDEMKQNLQSTKHFIVCLNASDISSTYKINHNDDHFIGSFFHIQKNVKDVVIEETFLLTSDSSLLSKSLNAGVSASTLGDFQKKLPPIHRKV